jgi:protein TonB
LRPIASIAALALHAAALASYRPQEGEAAVGPLEIELVVDPGPEARPTPDSLPAPEARAEPPPPEAVPDPAPEVPTDPPAEAPAPFAEADAAEPVSAEPAPEAPATVTPPPEAPPAPEEPPPEAVAVPLPPPPDPRDAVRLESPPEEKPKTRRPEKRREKKPPRPAASVESSRSQAARAEAAAARRAAIASYAGRVSAELRRHRHYPSEARDAGLTGTVVVSFTIGSGGRVRAHSIVRSSGHSILDRAVHRMMGAMSLPPPPGGAFSSTVPVRFDLTR